MMSPLSVYWRAGFFCYFLWEIVDFGCPELVGTSYGLSGYGAEPGPEQIFFEVIEIFLGPERFLVDPNQIYDRPERIFVEPDQNYGRPERIFTQPDQIYG